MQELSALGIDKARLRAELMSISEIAISEIAEAEAGRREEVALLLCKVEEREGMLGAHKQALLVEKEAASATLASAQCQLKVEQEVSSKQRHQLWQRLKRQAVIQAASARQMQSALMASQAEHEEMLLMTSADRKVAQQTIQQQSSELHALRMAVHVKDAEHTRRLAARGVIALKHGRKGKPHPRHVRCVDGRLEWGRPGEHADRSAKCISCAEIETIQGGVATDVARRSGRGRDELFLCVMAQSRTLDLEFATRVARDEWWQTIRSWHELIVAVNMPAGWTSALPHPPARLPTVGCADSAPATPATKRAGPSPPHTPPGVRDDLVRSPAAKEEMA